MSVAITGAAYVEAMDRDPVDREYRRAFLDLALSLAPRGGSVFDFGSGPGIDARHYAASGLIVGAYDVDDAMCEYFAKHCAAEISAGTVQLNTGPYQDFLRSSTARGGVDVDLIAANFAPLNLVADLPPLFAKFSAMLKPGGKLLLSVLNPFFHGLLGSPKWLARLPRLVWYGKYTSKLHGVIPVTRWHPGSLARQASPAFVLTAIHAPYTTPDGQPPQRVSLSDPYRWKHIATTQFLFLEFQRVSSV